MAKGIVVTSFTAVVSGALRVHNQGDEIEIPDGVDWVKAGWVQPARAQSPAQRRKKATSAKAKNKETR